MTRLENVLIWLAIGAGVALAQTATTFTSGSFTSAGAVNSAFGGKLDTAATATAEACESWDANTPVVAGTLTLPTPSAWAGTNSIQKVNSFTGGGGSFSVAVQLNGTNVTGCSAITVSGTSTTTTTCTPATFTGSGQIGFVISSPSGTVNTASVCAEISHVVSP